MSKLTKALIAAAGNAGESLYVEDVFSTYLYTGTGATQTITNGIDLAGEGGLVWLKARGDTYNNLLYDTTRPVNYAMFSNDTFASNLRPDSLTAFNSDGFGLGARAEVNFSGTKFTSWTFRKAEKFFDVVTYTGNSEVAQYVNHNLGVAPAVIILKSVDLAGKWYVWHKDLTSTSYSLRLNTTAAESVDTNYEIGLNASATQIYIDTGSEINFGTGQYVAYLFASDAGGYGADGSENIIKCGSFTLDGSGNASIDCGFEPQWVLAKRTDGVQDWYLTDMMRGMAQTTNGSGTLSPNLADAEYMYNRPKATATGFDYVFTPNTSYIYIAIRRPMKTPESGTEVFAASTRTSTTAPSFPASFNVVDAAFRIYRPGGGDYARKFGSRLTGVRTLYTSSTAAEVPDSEMNWDYMNGWNSDTGVNTDIFSWMFKRATGFFDVVAWTGDGVNYTHAHNLGVVPELMILKTRGAAEDWWVYHKDIGADYRLSLQSSAAKVLNTVTWQNTAPTSAEYSFGNRTTGRTYISYLFATVAGVSKVGSYTGNGGSSVQQIDCGFSSGARFILIKDADGTNDWYVWDSARGIVAGNDPYLLLNSTAAEATSTDYIDPLASGFTVTSTAPAALNASGGTYIFLAIA